MSKNLREFSKQSWSSRSGDGATTEEIRTGCQQRIAEALERLATGKTELETQKELEAARAQLSAAKRDLEWAIHVKKNLWRRVRAYKGVITKLKKRLEA